MKLIKATFEDIPVILKIVTHAQRYLAKLGIDQWQDGYPSEDLIKLDITNNDSYIIINSEGIIIGTSVFTFTSEITYQKIEGNWLTSKKAEYGVIHRLAVDDAYRKTGLAKFVFDTCEDLIKENEKAISLRIDTHRENLIMQELLKKRGYSYCGVIYLNSGDDRLAFEKVIN